MTASGDEQTYECLSLLADSHRQKASRLDRLTGSGEAHPGWESVRTRPKRTSQTWHVPQRNCLSATLTESDAVLGQSMLDIGNSVPEWVRFLQKCSLLLYALSADIFPESYGSPPAQPSPNAQALPARRDINELIGSVYLGASFALHQSSCYVPVPSRSRPPDPIPRAAAAGPAAAAAMHPASLDAGRPAPLDSALPPLLCSIAEDPAAGRPRAPLSPHRRAAADDRRRSDNDTAAADGVELRRRIAEFRAAFAEEARRFELAMLRQPAAAAAAAAGAPGAFHAAGAPAAPPAFSAGSPHPPAAAPSASSGGGRGGRGGGDRIALAQTGAAAAGEGDVGDGRGANRGASRTGERKDGGGRDGVGLGGDEEAEALREKVAAQARVINEWEHWCASSRVLKEREKVAAQARVRKSM
jgi:hypothetical protein